MELKEEQDYLSLKEIKKIQSLRRLHESERIRGVKKKKYFPTSVQLRNKHNQRFLYAAFNYVQGDFMDEVLNALQKRLSLPKSQIFKDALIYYKMFIETNFKKDGNNSNKG